MEVNLPFLFCFTLYLRAIFQVQAPRAYIWRGDLTEGFWHYWFGGAYIWRGLFSEFYGTLIHDLFQQYLYFLKTGFYCTPLLFSSVKNQHKTFLEHFSAAMTGKKYSNYKPQDSDTFNKTLTTNLNIEPSFEKIFLAWISNRKRVGRCFFHIF